VSNLSGSSGSEKHFKIFVPASKAQVMFLMSGGSGDADMYIRRGSPPNTTTWTYRPYLTSTTERVVVNNPTADGEWFFIMIKGYSSYSGIDFVAQFQAGPRLFDNGGTVRSVSGGHKEQRFFKIEVPFNSTKIAIKTTGGSGDVDLYLRANAIPSNSWYGYSSAHSGNTEAIVITNPLPGTWHVMLRGAGAYSGVKFSAECDGLPKFRMNKLLNKDQRPGVNFTSAPNYSWRYGNWGGPFWINGREQARSLWNMSSSAPAIDPMDELFEAHELAMKNAGGNDATEQQADNELEDGLADLPSGPQGVDHSFWGPIYVATGNGMPANVMVYPGSPYALPQVLVTPKLMPYSEYARRQAVVGLNSGWLVE